MRASFFLLATVLLFWSAPAVAQNSLAVKVMDGQTQEALPGASVAMTQGAGGSTDSHGNVILNNLPTGQIELKVSFIGYRDTTLLVIIPFGFPELKIEMVPEEEALDEVIITSTRNNRRIEDLPLKVEVLGLEEMNEESTLVPGNVASILGDLAVITIQRTNPINGNDAIRMQGLDPQYTLIARDGLPLYGGFSGSLGVLSIPPLDLKQIEIIKGSVSTLYGGGAIAGMLNFISKEPTIKPQRTILLNVSSLKERNINTFFSGKLSAKSGYTLVAGANLKSAIDVNNDGFSEIPEHQSFLVHPRFFFTPNEKTRLNIGITSTVDNRRTGDVEAVRNERTAAHPYLRSEKTFRNVIDFQYTHSFSTDHVFSIKSSASSYDRQFSVPVRFAPNFQFKGSQYSSYTEVSDRRQIGKNTLVTGLNLITESFRVASSDSVSFSSYDYITSGAFVQDDWDISDKFTVETGLRLDYHNVKGYFLLPRIALFYRPSRDLSFRLASGAGYKTPNVFSLVDPSPTLRNNIRNVSSERSTGVNADINYAFNLTEEISVSLNQAFYYAAIRSPLRIVTDTLSRTSFMENQRYTSKTLGTDSYVQAEYGRWELYLGYNHTEAIQQYAAVNNPMPFNPKDKFSTTLAYSVEKKWRTGIEASYLANQYVYNSLYYYNSQTLYPSMRVPNFWFWAAMIEKKFGFGSVILNCENVFDARQAKFGKLVTGSASSPTFAPVWGPLDGRVFNLSLKFDL